MVILVQVDTSEFILSASNIRCGWDDVQSIVKKLLVLAQIVAPGSLNIKQVFLI